MTEFEVDLTRSLAVTRIGEDMDIADGVFATITQQARARRNVDIGVAASCCVVSGLANYVLFRVAHYELPPEHLGVGNALAYWLPFAFLSATLTLAAATLAVVLTKKVG